MLRKAIAMAEGEAIPLLRMRRLNMSLATCGTLFTAP
ncbi:hypothetical protein SLEP1_g59669 [Rubroshorea leprosula]|uniref:Uncharacterized protein n=1 Tax=Rubroshorea leprosula TaxID=152421 RepID=A0AAV5MT03_9ROSI|nr:hypothetical protein SLEP1_g59669 [Rubroshorea leprosula]